MFFQERQWRKVHDRMRTPTPDTNAARPRAGGRRRGDRQSTADGRRAPGRARIPPRTRRTSSSLRIWRRPLSRRIPRPRLQIERDEPAPSEPSEHEIRLRAYFLYLDRGAFHGADFDDWLQAEMELKKR